MHMRVWTCMCAWGQGEFAAFGIRDLRQDDYILSGSNYFTPVVKIPQHHLDLSMIAEQQTKKTFSTVLALSARSKTGLRQLLDEGTLLLPALPESLATDICAAAVENQDINPISSLVCDTFQSLKRVSSSPNEQREMLTEDTEKARLMSHLSLLVTRGAQLLERIHETMVRIVHA